MAVATSTTPPLAVTPAEAARLLSISKESFDRYVRAEVRAVRKGRLVLIPIPELTRWIDANAALTLDET